MSGDLLARGMQVSRDLPSDMTLAGETTMFTREQLHAIELGGDVSLDAAAGSGKTSVLVERFVQAVLDDGIDVEAILTITFTDMAAAQMRDRIRARLAELGAADGARATEGAYISTIHGFCARVLRAHALGAGIDPAFVVLDELEAGRLADGAFEAALTELAEDAPDAVDLIAAYGISDLRAGTQSLYGELRSRGERRPRLPPLSKPPDLELGRQQLAEAATRASAELANASELPKRVEEALARLERLHPVIASDNPWPGELECLRLPGGNGAVLTTPVCVAYGEALTRFRRACAYRWAQPACDLLGSLLIRFGERYELRKRERSGLDFEDLELICRDLLGSDEELRERYRERFQRVMVDELQDTNAVQLELIELLARENLFTVGDAQQSIYGFRHADVQLFEQRGELLDAAGGRATLRTNFRSRPEILDVINRVFEVELGERFMTLVAGRVGESLDEPRVELLVADKEGDWSQEGPSAPWRVAEARALAARVGELVAAGAAPRDVVVLTRATTDMRAYERALEEQGIATYTVGGRGYWSHPQVVDLVAYLRTLANPRDEEALYAVLASPLVGGSLDSLVLLAAAARGRGRDPWWMLREPGDDLDEMTPLDREQLVDGAAWMAAEREAARWKGVEELLDRMLERTGYDLAMLAMPGGQRRLANVRKLMRLGREHYAAHGPDLSGFVELLALRAQSWRPDPDAGEAPIESEALDAVRLMTIHRAKGLEFEIVCVADLGRSPRSSTDLVRVSADGRVGLRLARPGTGAREPALAYQELGEERRTAEAGEERRLSYVAMTRARERLILSGAAKLDAWGGAGAGGAPISWLGPALVPDVAAPSGVSGGVRFTVVRSGTEVAGAPVPAGSAAGARVPAGSAPDAPWSTPDARRSAPDARRSAPDARRSAPDARRSAPDARRSAPDVDDLEPRDAGQDRPRQPEPTVSGTTTARRVSSLSYSALAAYRRCGYRFYVERVLGVPGPEVGDASPGRSAGTRGPVLSAAERGTLVHSLLERLDFRRPVLPSSAAIIAAAPRPPSAGELDAVTELVQRFAASELCARLGRATGVAREQRFGFLLGGALITGMLDVIARESAKRSLIVDYKTDRLERTPGEKRDPAAVVAREYATQQLIYALAGLRAGAAEVEVVHVFLEAPDEPISATFSAAEGPALERTLAELSDGVLRKGSFAVSDTPHRELCSGCPAEGGLCSWPLEMTRRESPEQLF